MQQVNRIIPLASGLLAVLLLLAILAGCTGSGDANGEKKNDGQTSGQSGNDGTGKPTEPVKLSIMVTSRVPDSPLTMETPFWKELGKRLNIEFEFVTGDYDQLEQKFKLMLASGDYPDIVALNTELFKKYGPQGAFIPLNDLVKQHGPNIQKYLLDDPTKRMMALSSDGNLYGVPLQTAIRASEGYMIRQDWLDRLGLKKPVTIDDWHTVLKAFKDQDANGNGDPNDEIPLMTDYAAYTTFADAWGIHIHPSGPRWIEEDDTIKFSPIDPRLKDYLKTMNQWYAEGLLDKEFLTRQDPDLERMMFSDRMGAGQHWIGYMAAYNANPAAEKIKGFNLQVVAPPVLREGDQPMTFRQQAPLHGIGWAISKNNQHPEETMKLFDYIYGEEGQRLANFGFEEDTFTLGEGDKPVFTEKIMKSPEGPAKALWRLGIVPLIGFRQDEQYERQYAVTKDVEKQMFFYVENNYFHDLFLALNFTEEEEKRLNDIRTPMFTYIDEMIPKFIIGTEKLDNFDDYVAKVKSMRYSEMEEIYMAAYDRYKKQLNEG
ncbi:extracellular solute-binding protein [Paenibacillus sp. GCM10027626]|uniref:extracellular solute-binding protein n=1 Tax=Paenibacillus sp. GCM10027626 TaxID=3273411 RepID=UPI0036285A9D